MNAARELFEHAAGVGGGAGFAEDAAFEGDDSVRGEDDGRAGGACGHKFGFGIGKAPDEIVGGFAGDGSFVDGGWDRDEREAGDAEDFGAAG